MRTRVRMTIGSRELKTRLGTYLRHVREGTTIIVTDRGRPVAELRPLSRSEDDVESRLRELVLAGVVSGEVAERANPDAVRENLARELGIDERKAKQLFSGRTVVVRGHLDYEEAQLWQDKLGRLCLKGSEFAATQDLK